MPEGVHRILLRWRTCRLLCRIWGTPHCARGTTGVCACGRAGLGETPPSSLWDSKVPSTIYLDPPCMEYRHAPLVYYQGIITLSDLVGVIDAICGFRDDWRLPGGEPGSFSPREERLLGRQWRAIVVLLGPTTHVREEYVDWRRWEHHLTALQGMEKNVPDTWRTAGRATRVSGVPVTEAPCRRPPPCW